MLRTRYIPPLDIFPADPWVFEAVRFDRRLAQEFVSQGETIFALSNGYLGIRGMFAHSARMEFCGPKSVFGDRPTGLGRKRSSSIFVLRRTRPFR
jgi:alpha,alpha-trehalose phosphorylase